MLRALFPRAVALLALCVLALGCSASDHGNNAAGEHVSTISLALDAGVPDSGLCTTNADCGNGCGVCYEGTCITANPGTVCRAAAGVCDAPEACDGTSVDCPVDLKQPTTFECRASQGVCDLAETCNGGDACPADARRPTTFECRASQGACDAAETCNGGVACPADLKQPNTFECRPSIGACDVAETCNGGDTCPADVVKDATVQCRAGNGICNPAENCDGQTAACPADVLAPVSTVCRAAAGVCDVAEKCDGAGNCPVDVKNSGTQCRASNGECDKPELCDGTNVNCPADAKFGPTDPACRVAADVCDKPEFCNGASDTCPAVDAKLPATTVCRPATLPCDLPETCTGSTDACPADSFKAATVQCRAAGGLCDVAENCTGQAAACPVDVYLPPNAVCRAKQDACDVAELCTGGSIDCPPDGFAPNTVMCRDVLNGNTQCDQPEFCTGSAAQCPPNSYKPKGTACDDQFDCTVNDTCDGSTGTCAGVPDRTRCEPDKHTCAYVFCAVGQGCAFNLTAKGQTCRASVGACDVVETCDGTNQDCPSDVIKPNTASCQALSCTDGTVKPEILCTGLTGVCPTVPDSSCGNFACGSSTECRTTCVTSADCDPAFYCVNNDCVPRIGAGQKCKSDSECPISNNHCVDGVCCDTTCTGQCEACNVTGKVGTCVGVKGNPIEPRDKCAADGSKCDGFCDPSNRTACQFPVKGTSCRDPSCDPTSNAALAESFCTGKGSCALTEVVACEPYACFGQACAGNCSADAQCAQDAYCQAGKCTPKGKAAAKCTTDKQCGSGHCADGVCCDTACTGQCEACNNVPDAPAGTCSAVSGDPLGNRRACAAVDAACGGACDGKNRLTCSYPAQGKVCRPGACADGQATVSSYCDGHGACPAALTVSCAKGCEGSVCAGDECVLDADCNDSGKYCAAGVCTAKGAPGSACSAASACQTGFCADGVCCDSACLGQCEACDASGSVGTCSAVPKGDSPHGGRVSCASDGSVCGGACDGTQRSSCKYPFDVVCRAGSCAAGAGPDDPATSVVEASCLGNGSCPTEQQQLCGADGCDAKNKLCNGACAADKNACKAGEYCAAGECVAQLPAATACANDAQCESKFCVDGVCCDQRCGDQCAACDVPGSVGTCTASVGGTHGGRAACGGVGTCGATCDGTIVASCSFAGSDVSCGEAFCSAGVRGDAPLCDGQGVCAPAVTTACKSFQCDGVACSTACTQNSDCVKQLECRNGECVPPLLIDAVDKGSCGCALPGSTSRPPASVVCLLGLCAVAALRRRRRAA